MRLPTVSCLASVTIIFHCLVYISFKNRVSQSWPNADKVTALVGVMLAPGLLEVQEGRQKMPARTPKISPNEVNPNTGIPRVLVSLQK